LPVELLVWLVLGFVALAALHELTHVLIARWHGHPTVCVAINPVGVAVVFEDTPRIPYWAFQVILPALVTWVVCYIWLYVSLVYPSGLQTWLAIHNRLDYLPAVVTLLTIVTSGGDIVSAIMEVTRPVWGDDRIRRDFRVLKRVPTLVVFTQHGRQRWQAVWAEEAARRGRVGLT